MYLIGRDSNELHLIGLRDQNTNVLSKHPGRGLYVF